MENSTFFIIADPTIVTLDLNDKSDPNKSLTKILNQFQSSKNHRQDLEIILRDWEKYSISQIRIYLANTLTRFRSVAPQYIKYNHFLGRFESNFKLESMDLENYDCVFYPKEFTEKIIELSSMYDFRSIQITNETDLFENSQLQNVLTSLEQHSPFCRIRGANPDLLRLRRFLDIQKFARENAYDLINENLFTAAEKARKTDPAVIHVYNAAYDLQESDFKKPERLQIIEDILQKDPNNEVALCAKIMFLIENDQVKEAENLIPRVEGQIDIKNGSFAIIPNMLWTKKGIIKEKIKELIQNIEENPRKADLWAKLAFLNHGKEEVDYAAEFAIQALYLDTDYSTSQMAGILGDYEALMLPVFPRTPGGIFWGLQRLLRVPEDVSKWTQLASLIMMFGREEEALSCFRQAIMMNPKTKQDKLFERTRKMILEIDNPFRSWLVEEELPLVEELFQENPDYVLHYLKVILYDGNPFTLDFTPEPPDSAVKVVEFIDSHFSNEKMLTLLREVIQDGEELHPKIWWSVYGNLRRYHRHPDFAHLVKKIGEEILIGARKTALFEKFMEHEAFKEPHPFERLAKDEDIHIRNLAIKFSGRTAPMHTAVEILVQSLEDSEKSIQEQAKKELIKRFGEKFARTFLDKNEKEKT